MSRPPNRPWRLRAALLGLLLVLLTGCAAYSEADEIGDMLEQTGYEVNGTSAGVSNSTSYIAFEVETDKPRDMALDEIANVTWTNFPMEFDELRVELNGSASWSITDDRLEQTLGPRPDGLDAREVGDEVLEGILTVAIILVVVFLLGLAIVTVLTIWLVRRARRRREARAAWLAQYQQGPYQQGPYQQGPPPGYHQGPPPGQQY